MTPKQLAKKLPKHIKLGAFKFKLSVSDDWVRDGKQKYWGLFNPKEEVLSIGNLNEMSSTRLFVGVLWHELFHGLWYVQGLSKRSNEEDIARSFEQAFLSVCIDNPWLLPWTMKGLK